jgi:hypothetical protein
MKVLIAHVATVSKSLSELGLDDGVSVSYPGGRSPKKYAKKQMTVCFRLGVQARYSGTARGLAYTTRDGIR